MDHSDDDDYNIQGGEGGDVESGGGGRSSFIERRESNMSSFSEAAREPLLHLKSRVNTTQIAIVGSKVYPVESLDYEIFENELIKQDWRSRKRVEIFQYIFSQMDTCSVNRIIHRYFQAFAAFAGINVILAFCAAALCAFIAPAAAGSGIPEVKAYLNGVDAHSILAPSTLFVKIFGSIFGVSAGFVVGKEGPMVHTGACIANLLGQGGSRKYHLTWKWLRYFKNDRDRRDLITCGAAAGVAAAFRAPVGGVLFALEEAASWWRSALLWRTFFTTAVVAVVLRSLIQFCRNGNCGLFGQGGLIMFDVNSAVPAYNTVDLLAVLLIGVLGGLLGCLYNYLVDKVLRTYSIINERGPALKILLVITISLLTSCCAFGLPWLVQCTPCPSGFENECPTIGRSGNYKNFQCQPGHYNDLASLFFNTNDDAIRNLFSPRHRKQFQISTLLIFFVGTYFLGIITYGIAVPSGLFIPVILAGSSYGRLVGRLVGPISNLDVGLLPFLELLRFLVAP
ncbi:UNVERIFIED_CONTAM: Chloride channel protein CLC-c [Sesamum angustifolium]|uniref:Chloride channel protein CLC-c n=1 Tax=Sesamum angustifolium TaxID=2727405 RepID=A0AAW2QAT6_9LAMI